MPGLEIRDLYQRAVVWLADGTYDAYGQAKVSPTPQEIAVRWNDVQKEALDPQGNTIRVDAQVVVVMNVPVGSAIWLGKLDDLPGTGLVPQRDVMQVIGYNNTPDLKNRYGRKSLNLIRRMDSLPTQSS